MNERIRELAVQAGQHADTYDDTSTPIWFQMYNEKFAELIVQECMGVVSRKCASPTAYQALAEHFGVEE